MSTLTEKQIAEWVKLRGDMLANTVFTAERAELEGPRNKARPEICALRTRYLNGEITVGEFRATYQVNTAGPWNYFALKGFAGAMFLNMLVKNVPDQQQMERELNQVLHQPVSDDDASSRLTQFQTYVDGLVADGQVAINRLQVGHARFFVTSWWHMEEPEKWPIFYRSAIDTFKLKGLLKLDPTNKVAGYFDFRETYLRLMTQLNLTTTGLESLCGWIMAVEQVGPEANSVQVIKPTEATATGMNVLEAAPVAQSNAVEGRKHTQIQYLLARIGQKFGYKVWIARNDRKAVWEDQPLGQLSMDKLPPLVGVDGKSLSMIELIDVVWVKGFSVTAAFEVESTTSIFSGLLRLSDLSLTLEGFNFPLFIAAPKERFKEVEVQLSRRTFQELKLPKACWYFSFEDLIKDADALQKYGHNSDDLKKLSRQVSALYQDED